MIDETHPSWSATIPAFCQEVLDNPEFTTGQVILISYRDIAEHEKVTGTLIDSSEALAALIPVPDFPLKVFHHSKTGDYIIARPGNTPLPNEAEYTLLRSTPLDS